VLNTLTPFYESQASFYLLVLQEFAEVLNTLTPFYESQASFYLLVLQEFAEQHYSQ